jgi:hypothetical protein
MNKSNRFLYSFIGLIIFQIIMCMEEIIGHYPKYITIFTGKLHDKLSFFPVIQISEQLYMFINLIIIIILFVFLAFVFIESRWAKILAVVLGLIVILNGGFHIFSSLYFMRYIPGSISAIGLIVFGFLVILIKPPIQKEREVEE